MRIGLMFGSDKERPPAARLEGVVGEAAAAEGQGFTSFWFPQVPGYLDAMTVLTVVGRATGRIELGTAVVPIQSRHPVPMAQQALTTQMACGGRFTLGLGVSHHWIVEDQWGLPYGKPAATMRDYLDVLDAAFAGPVRFDVENATHRVHSPIDVDDRRPPPVLLAALAPVMLRLAGERASGTILWMADERAIGDFVVPRLSKVADDAGRPAPRVVARVPVALCGDGEVADAQRVASEVLGHADISPNYLALLEHGDAEDVGDTMAAGDEAAILERLGRYRDAGVTDLAARVVGLGGDPATRRPGSSRAAAPRRFWPPSPPSSERSAALVDPAVLHHEADVGGDGDVVGRVAGDGDDVGPALRPEHGRRHLAAPSRAARASSPRAMTRRCISLVPSPITISGASR